MPLRHIVHRRLQCLIFKGEPRKTNVKPAVSLKLGRLLGFCASEGLKSDKAFYRLTSQYLTATGCHPVKLTGRHNHDIPTAPDVIH